MPLKNIRERRRHTYVERTFERRSSGGEDVRLTQILEDMGAEKVRTKLSQVGFGDQNGVARQWLESQEESPSGGWVFKLMLAVAIGGSVGALFFSYFD